MSCIAELKRRNVFRVVCRLRDRGFAAHRSGLGHLPGLHLPDWTLTFLISSSSLRASPRVDRRLGVRADAEGLKREAEL